MSESTRTPNDTRCPYCDSQVTLVNGLFPPHENAAGNRCLGPDAEPGSAAPTTFDYEPGTQSTEGGWQGASQPGVSSPVGVQGQVGVLPPWISGTAHRPAAGAVGWGLVLSWIGPVLAWFGLSMAVNDAFAYERSGGGGGTALTVIGGLLSLVGLVMLCVGITRLVAKADVAFNRRHS